jgi:hypothetical protein
VSAAGVGLAEALERAAGALPAEADRIRPANGDPLRLLELLDAAAATRVLGWLLAHEPEDGAELAAAWAEAPEAGAAAVLAVDEAGLPRAGRKALRRVRHQLRSRGVAVSSPPPQQVVATLPPVEDRLDEALLSPLDPRGTRAAFLVSSHPSGGARMFEVLLDDLRGLLETRVYNVGRSQLRRFVRSFTQRDEFPAVSAPPDAVRALIARIAAAQPADRPLPRGFVEWRAQLAGAPQAARTPGEIVRGELADVAAEPSLLRRAAEQVRAHVLGPWPPPADALHGLAERLGEAARGQVILSPAQRRQQLDAVLDQALEALFAEPFAERTAERFEETAYWWWRRGSEQDARVCLAAARAFREGGVRENPVARAMIEVVMAPVLAKLEEQIAEEQREAVR